MELNLNNPLVYAVPLFVSFIVFELILSYKHDKDLYLSKDLLASASMGAGATVIAALFTKKWGELALFYMVFELSKDFRLQVLGYESLGWAWYVWLICQFFDDFNYYWHHRLSHTVRVLWAAHIVHHSSDHFNYGTGIRNGWFTLFYKPIFWLWLPLIGFEPMMVATCLGIQAVYQFFLHTQSVPNLGFLEKFMNTPRQHQVHHSCNLEYLDKNHGGFLNIFDRVFGSFLHYDEKIVPSFGVLHPPQSYNPFIIVSHEYAAIWNDVKNSKNPYQAFMYVFGEPGWSPDGSSKTARQAQAELRKQANVLETV